MENGLKKKEVQIALWGISVIKLSFLTMRSLQPWNCPLGKSKITFPEICKEIKRLLGDSNVQRQKDGANKWLLFKALSETVLFSSKLKWILCFDLRIYIVSDHPKSALKRKELMFDCILPTEHCPNFQFILPNFHNNPNRYYEST